MIRCKLISPTNLMLEHPLHFAAHDESEFYVLGRKEYLRHRMRWIQLGVLVGIAAAAALVGIFSLIVTALR